MARRRSSVRMQARPASNVSGTTIMGLIVAAFVGIIVLMLVIRQKQKSRALRREMRKEEFLERSVEITGTLAALAGEKLSAMKTPQRLPDEDWREFRSYRDEGLVDAMILARTENQTKYIDGAFSRGQPPELKESERTKQLEHDVSMSKGEVTLGGETIRVRIFRKPVMDAENKILGTVVLLMEPPAR